MGFLKGLFGRGEGSSAPVPNQSEGSLRDIGVKKAQEAEVKKAQMAEAKMVVAEHRQKEREGREEAKLIERGEALERRALAKQAAQEERQRRVAEFKQKWSGRFESALSSVTGFVKNTAEGSVDLGKKAVKTVGTAYEGGVDLGKKAVRTVGEAYGSAVQSGKQALESAGYAVRGALSPEGRKLISDKFERKGEELGIKARETAIKYGGLINESWKKNVRGPVESWIENWSHKRLVAKKEAEIRSAEKSVGEAQQMYQERLRALEDAANAVAERQSMVGSLRAELESLRGGRAATNETAEQMAA